MDFDRFIFPPDVLKGRMILFRSCDTFELVWGKILPVCVVSFMAFNIDIKKLSDRAIIPQKWYSNDAGFDLYAADEILLAPGIRGLVPTDIAISIPPNYFGKIEGRSGLSIPPYCLDTGAGIIDRFFIRFFSVF